MRTFLAVMALITAIAVSGFYEGNDHAYGEIKRACDSTGEFKVGAVTMRCGRWKE